MDAWRYRLRKFICTVCFATLLFCGTHALAYAPSVTMSVADANLGVVLAEVARMGKANIVINVKPTDTITVTFDRVPFETALYYIARTKGLSIDKKNGNTYVVTTLEDMERGFREVKVFQLKYARADHIKNVIVGGGKSDSEFLVENPGASGKSGSGTLDGKISAATTSSANKEGLKGLVLNTDASTNALIAFGSPEQLEHVRHLLKELDVPYQQILLEAQVMALSKSASKSLGIDWSWSQFPPPSQSSTSTSTTSYFPVGIVTGGDGQVYKFGVNATLNALITNGDGKLLARPNVLTINGNKATIFVGDELPVVTPSTSSSGGSVTYTTEYKKAGITLAFVPRTNDEDNIAASVFVEVSTPMTVTLEVGGQKTTAYQITTRSAQTNVRLKDGDTMVIGGLISSTDVKNFNKVPFLGDLPVLGKLFQSVSKSKNETEVVIFLKAKIVK
jgi:type II secretory pathway component GspD/PulD (secretin)